MSSELQVSVIVPVWNDSKRILKCIEALQNQTLDSHLYEILVVDNGSLDDTYEVLEKVKGITLLREVKPGSYAARNKAIHESNGEILAFTDSDCMPDSRWLEEITSCLLSNEKIGIVAGEIEFFKAPEDNVEKEALAFESMFSMNQKKYASEGLCITANWCSRKEIILAQSGFRTDLKSGGDHDMSKKIVESGLTVEYCKTAKVLHPARNNSELLRKRRRVIGGTWDKSNSKFKAMKILVNSSKLFLKRIYKTLTAANYSLYQRGLIAKVLFMIFWVSISEVIHLIFGKESTRS
ncbi:glycosyltransferase [Alteromonas sp. Mac1]|uniref:glycosyltransferase n=1 Tax=Alteromonas sp. Mac1 TaxID=1777491 RepID=UPI00076FE975|nr:glycosyltransferase family 2 protein [Alteromonas sp. Mac1]AMJ86441.1 hypothetical protein AV939_07495 [Alteromonas sp. Mac1]AMJ90300.1 hypothetical protein AV940_07325 [Alteromonas sp. Mac2]